MKYTLDIFVVLRPFYLWTFSTQVIRPSPRLIALTSELYSACRFWSDADRICCRCTARWCNTSRQQIRSTSCPGSRRCFRFLFCPLLRERAPLWEPPVIEWPPTETQYRDASLFIDSRRTHIISCTYYTNMHVVGWITKTRKRLTSLCVDTKSRDHNIPLWHTLSLVTLTMWLDMVNAVKAYKSYHFAGTRVKCLLYQREVFFAQLLLKLHQLPVHPRLILRK